NKLLPSINMAIGSVTVITGILGFEDYRYIYYYEEPGVTRNLVALADIGIGTATVLINGFLLLKNKDSSGKDPSKDNLLSWYISPYTYKNQTGLSFQLTKLF
ncbi:MAG: hypothetical protein IH946_08240, partial [Bacteroidetes bacterium]|nr:hypothetical protein [Bacteroidota bacterium]